MINKTSIDLITNFEGFVDHWYPDPATGGEPMTCCYGHTNAAGDPKYNAATKGYRFTLAEGVDILRKDLNAVENEVRKLIKVPVNDNQLGALVSLDYNIGIGNFSKSTLLKKLNAGDYEGAANQFQVWNKANKKVMAGLTRRRADEAALFRSPVKKDNPVESFETEIAPSPKPNLLSTLINFIISIFTRKR